MTMKKILISCLMMTAFSAVSLADTLTVRKLFAEMPDAVVPYLTTNNRLDMLDFMDSNMKAEVTNDLGGKSLMTALSDDSISIRLNEASQLDMLLLTATEEIDSCRQVLMLVRTVIIDHVSMEAAVEFYSARWNRLDVVPTLIPDDQKKYVNHKKTLSISNFIQEKLNKD